MTETNFSLPNMNACNLIQQDLHDILNAAQLIDNKDIW